MGAGNSNDPDGVSDQQKTDIAKARASRTVTSFDMMFGEDFAQDKFWNEGEIIPDSIVDGPTVGALHLISGYAAVFTTRSFGLSAFLASKV